MMMKFCIFVKAEIIVEREKIPTVFLPVNRFILRIFKIQDYVIGC